MKIEIAMKSVFRFALTIMITITLLAPNTMCAYSSPNKSFNDIVLDYQNNQPDMIYVTHQQTKAQFEFFMRVLDELGPPRLSKL